jgi:hypothetical protein
LEDPTLLTDITVTDIPDYVIMHFKSDELLDNDFKCLGLTAVVQFRNIMVLLYNMQVKWEVIMKI